MTDLLRADVRAHCAIGERALPECAHKKRLLAHLVSLRFAAERRAALCVFDRRRRDARDEKKPGPASMASDAKTTSKTEKRKPNDLVRDSFGETDRVEWQLTASASRTDNGKDDPWWFADGVVVLVTAADAEAREENENENENENVSEAPAPRGDDDDDDDDDDEKTKPRRTVSTQFPDARFFDEFAETARTRETTWASESPSARLVSEKKKPETTSASAWSFPSLGDWSDWSGADTSHSSNQKRNDFEVSVLSASDAEHVRRLARQLASPRDVFVIVETCDGTKGRVELENALDAASRATGIDASRILCLESTLESESNATIEKKNVSRWRAGTSTWYREWARERAATLWPAFAEARATVRFWGALGGDAEMKKNAVRTRRREERGADENERIAPSVSAASALRSAAEAVNAPSTTTNEKIEKIEKRTGDASEASAASVPAAAASALASAAASRSLYSFLRWAIEGRPQFGVAGAPAIAAARLESDPGVMRRAALSAALYSYSAAEFAAGFLLSWAVPGPLAAHAAHFTNRFRVCFAVACMAGASPLDPRVAAVVLATCAGADGAAMKRAAFVTRDSERESASTTGRVRDGSDVSSTGSKDFSFKKKKNDDDGNDEPTDASTSRSTLFGSLTSAVRRVADGGDAMRRDAVEAMRRVYDAGGDAIRRAERDADEIATRAFRVALVTERKKRSKAFETGATDDAVSVSRRRVLIASADASALTTARRAFANRLASAVASECAAVVCGPLWLAATQADVVSVLAGAMSVHVCNASLQVFLPPRGTPVTTDASLLSSNAGGIGGRNIGGKNRERKKETSLLSDAAAAAAEMASDAAASARDVAAEARRVAAEASSNVTRWASAAASVVLMQRSGNGSGASEAETAKPEAAPESKAKATAPSGWEAAPDADPSVFSLQKIKRASLLALVADDDARALARSPSAVLALMRDTRVAAAMADENVRRTLGAFVEASQKRNDEESSEKGEEEVLRDDVLRDVLRDVSEEDESAVLAAVDRAAEVLLASGDADARVVAERHGLVGVPVPVPGDDDAVARRAFEAAKASRYAGYRDAVEKARGKYFLTASV